MPAGSSSCSSEGPEAGPEKLARLRNRLVAASTQHASVNGAILAHRQLGQWPKSAGACRALSGALRRERLARRLGKPYDLTLPMYMRDMGVVLTRLLSTMRPGAAVAVVVGDSAPYDVHVHTPRLLGRLAEEIGYCAEGSEKLRSRGQRFRSVSARHQRELSDVLMLLRRPARPRARATTHKTGCPLACPLRPRRTRQRSMARDQGIDRFRHLVRADAPPDQVTTDELDELSVATLLNIDRLRALRAALAGPLDNHGSRPPTGFADPISAE